MLVGGVSAYDYGTKKTRPIIKKWTDHTTVARWAVVGGGVVSGGMGAVLGGMIGVSLPVSVPVGAVVLATQALYNRYFPFK
jgi:NAD(P)H-hydrate repair Nnr-like enzyme with NAD(P)H-hydrate dehydratase domain